MVSGKFEIFNLRVGALRPTLVVCRRRLGLAIFSRGFLSNIPVQSLLGHSILQPSVFVPHGLEFHFRLHTTVLLKPARLDLFCDPKPFANLLLPGSPSARHNLEIIWSLR